MPVPILLMAEQLGSGGTERQLVETALALDRDRFEPHVACLHTGFHAPKLEAAGVPILEFDLRSFISFQAVSAAVKLRRYMRSRGIRLAHTFDYPMTCFGVPIARAAGVEVVLSSQRVHRDLCPPIYRKLLRWTDRMVHGTVVNCQAMRRHLIEDEHVKPERIELCYNSVDTAVFRPANGSPVDRQAIEVGTVSVLRPEKGGATLLEAFAKARSSGQKLRLTIVGSGPLEQELRSLAGQLGIAPDCHFEPAVSDVTPWLQSMQIFVLPSMSEALSNSLMEAMATGCAPIASDVGGNPELVEDGRNGFLFPAGDVEALARRIRKLAEDAELRARFGEAASQKIHAQFNRQAAAARMMQIYERFLAEKR